MKKGLRRQQVRPDHVVLVVRTLALMKKGLRHVRDTWAARRMMFGLLP